MPVTPENVERLALEGQDFEVRAEGIVEVLAREGRGPVRLPQKPEPAAYVC